jgi:hypothetical protein
MAMSMRILWAVSSVGKGHIMRDTAVAGKLQEMCDACIDWLVPDPGGEFLRSRGYNVLDCSGRLSGSGKVYARVFEGSGNEQNLMDYIRADTRLHRHDFFISRDAWKNKEYDVIVGDEAFWLLTGFASRWAAKPAPFVFLTDFIGVKSLRPGFKDNLLAWYNNVKFTMSYWGPDEYVYIGDRREIPDEPLGRFLPGRRTWARKHCRFVRPVVGFDPAALPDKSVLRRQLGLPSDKLVFLAVGSAEGGPADAEAIFEILRNDKPDAHFMITGVAAGGKSWIHYHGYLDKLYEYFAASDFVLTQAGYGKIAELSAMGTPFLAIPFELHFEQEYVMAHRLAHYETGKIVTLRDHSPKEIAAMVLLGMERQTGKISADNGTEVAGIILKAGRSKTQALSSSNPSPCPLP